MFNMHMQQCHDDLTEIWRPNISLWFVSFLLSGYGILQKCVFERVGRLHLLKCPYVQHAYVAMSRWFDEVFTSGNVVMIRIIFTVGWWYYTKVCIWTSWQITSSEVSLCSACICSHVMKIWGVSDLQISRYKMYHFYCRLLIFYDSVCLNELADYF